MQEIKIGDLVRHRHILRGTDLSVVNIDGEKIVVRYASAGLFQTQELLLSEVERFDHYEEEFK